MKNKKGIVLTATLLIVYGIIAIIILGLLIFLGFKISQWVTPIIDFVKQYWWAFLIGVVVIFFNKPLRMILNKIGVKI